MVDWRARFREWLGIPHTAQPERDLIELELRRQRQRLDRLAGIDARLPHRRFIGAHPHRRASDRR